MLADIKTIHILTILLLSFIVSSAAFKQGIFQKDFNMMIEYYKPNFASYYLLNILYSLSNALYSLFIIFVGAGGLLILEDRVKSS